MVNITNNTSKPVNVTNPSDKNPYFGSLTILTSLFFMWGFITCLNDILIPHLKAVFTLSYAQAMLVQFCFFIAYFVVSVPSGYLVEKIDYKAVQKLINDLIMHQPVKKQKNPKSN